MLSVLVFGPLLWELQLLQMADLDRQLSSFRGPLNNRNVQTEVRSLQDWLALPSPPPAPPSLHLFGLRGYRDLFLRVSSGSHTSAYLEFSPKTSNTLYCSPVCRAWVARVAHGRASFTLGEVQPPTQHCPEQSLMCRDEQSDWAIHYGVQVLVSWANQEGSDLLAFSSTSQFLKPHSVLTFLVEPGGYQIGITAPSRLQEAAPQTKGHQGVLTGASPSQA